MKPTKALLDLHDGTEWETKFRIHRGVRQILINDVWTPLVRTGQGTNLQAGIYHFKRIYYSKES
jgi:hypothetical protein